MAKTEEELKKEVILIKWGLLGCWFCSPLSKSEDEIAEAVKLSHAGCPVEDLVLVKDRLYGGFLCGNDREHAHIFFDAGAYTYLNPEENSPVGTNGRSEEWGRLLKDVEIKSLHTDVAFISDRPEKII